VNNELEATVKRFSKALLFLGYDVPNAVSLAVQFAVGFSHGSANTLTYLCEKWLMNTQVPTVAGSAPDYTSQYVLAIRVSRGDAFCDQKSNRAGMVSNSPARNVGLKRIVS